MRGLSNAVMALAISGCPGPAEPTARPIPALPASAPTMVPVAAPGAPAPPPPGPFRVVEPPAGIGARDGVVAARVIALGDTQLHHMIGKRTFAQSPWADRVLSFEVAIRPAALDDGADLLLEAFLEERRVRYPRHTLVYMGDAADLSCIQEYQRFFAQLDRERPFLMVTSNHDGFYAGNFTQKQDAGGGLSLTDMPLDWSRACAEPGALADRRLTKGRSVAKIASVLPPAPEWATHVQVAAADDPSGYTRSWLAYVRPLGGGDPGAPPAWGVFLDTVDYRGFDLRKTRGAGTTGGISSEQLAALDHGMFEARMQGGRDLPIFVAFGHHPTDQLERGAKKRFLRFLDTHPEIVAVVTAHTHVSDERRIDLPSGRSVPELVVGSTTDWPNAGRLLEVRAAGRASPAGVASWRLLLDTDALCAGIPPLEADAVGYVGYRMSRDDTPDVSLDAFDKLAFAFGLSELEEERVVQSAGAMLVENDLVRGLAALYRRSPLPLDEGARARLDRILSRRFAAGDVLGDLPALAKASLGQPLSEYDRWVDPVLYPAVPLLARGLYSFGAQARLFSPLQAARTATPESRRWFACHAARAAQAEAARPRKKANVAYVP